MYFDLRSKREVFPEIGDVFTVTNGEKEYQITCKESDSEASCSGCAFENLCKDYDYNKTQFVCYGEDRPDNTNVIFVWE